MERSCTARAEGMRDFRLATPKVEDAQKSAQIAAELDFHSRPHRANVWMPVRHAAGRDVPMLGGGPTPMRGRKNPPLDLTPEPVGTPLTFDTMARAYLEDYTLQRYRTLTTARGRVQHLREFFGGWPVESVTANAVRAYQLQRRREGAEAATVNRETSALSRMFHLAIRRGQLDRMPLFPNRLEENPPRDGFFEHAEYLKVRECLPPSWQDVLDFAYYSGWRRSEIPRSDLERGGPGRWRHSSLPPPLEDQDRTSAPRH